MTEITELVGILNVTPDSFSDGGLYEDHDAAIRHATEMLFEGASIIDVGAESTRPHATPISPAEERRRLEPILWDLIERYPNRISLDTRHSETAKWALGVGRVIINDMSGMTNPSMVRLVADYEADCIIGHIPGNDVHASHTGELLDDVAPIKTNLLLKKLMLVELGLQPERIILDPGIGFGKTAELNAQLLRFAQEVPGHRVMIGASKKRFIEDYFVEEGESRYDIEPNLRAARVAIDAGAAYLRVHDVARHRQLLY